MGFLLSTLLFLISLLLIGLILLQRGRGGGLAGAFGGAGGQSAFGTKAGDTFTQITIGLAFVWILLCAITVKLYSGGNEKFDASLGADVPIATPAVPGSAADGTPAAPSGNSAAAPAQNTTPSATPAPTGGGEAPSTPATP